MPVILDNPVINAYVQGLQMRRQQENDKFNQDQQKQQSARADQQLKGYLQHLDAQTEAEKQRLEIQKQNLELEKKSHVFKAQQAIAEMINKGQYDPNGQVPDQTQVGGQIQTTQTPGGVGPTYDVTNLPTNIQNVQPTLSTMPSAQPAMQEIAPGVMFNPAGVKNNDQIFQQHLAQLKAQAPVEAELAGQKAGAVAKATAEVTQPFELSKIEAKSAADLKLQQEKAALALAVAEKNSHSRLVAANISAAARKYAADKSNSVNPEMITNNAILHATGQGGTALGNGKDDVATKLVMNKLGYVDFSSKDAQGLKEIHGMDPLYAKMEQVINSLPDDKVNAAGQRILSAIPGTDLNNLKNEIIAASGNIARTRGSEKGVLTDRDINRQINALVKPGMTKQQALENLRFLQQYTTSKVADQILGGMSDRQKILVLDKYDFDPMQVGGSVAYQGKEYVKYARNPNNPEEWGVFNPKTGHYDKIGDK